MFMKDKQVKKKPQKTKKLKIFYGYFNQKDVSLLLLIAGMIFVVIVINRTKYDF